MIRVVFDTVVFVRCLISPFGLCGRLVSEYSHRYRLFVSKPLVTEILEVLRRPEIAGKFSVLLDISPARVLEILGQAEVVEVEDIPAVCRDPQDDKFLATALAAGVDYLVSEDDDLLSLGTYQGIKITNATRFLELLEQASATRPDS